MEAVCRGAKESPETFEGATVAILPSGRTEDATRLLTLLWPLELVFHALFGRSCRRSHRTWWWSGDVIRNGLRMAV